MVGRTRHRASPPTCPGTAPRAQPGRVVGLPRSRSRPPPVGHRVARYGAAQRAAADAALHPVERDPVVVVVGVHGGGDAQVPQGVGGPVLPLQGAPQHVVGVVVAGVLVDQRPQLLLGAAELGGLEVRPGQQLPDRGVARLGGHDRLQQPARRHRRPRPRRTFPPAGTPREDPSSPHLPHSSEHSDAGTNNAARRECSSADRNAADHRGQRPGQRGEPPKPAKAAAPGRYGPGTAGAGRSPRQRPGAHPADDAGRVRHHHHVVAHPGDLLGAGSAGSCRRRDRAGPRGRPAAGRRPPYGPGGTRTRRRAAAARCSPMYVS